MKFRWIVLKIFFKLISSDKIKLKRFMILSDRKVGLNLSHFFHEIQSDFFMVAKIFLSLIKVVESTKNKERCNFNEDIGHFYWRRSIQAPLG